MSASGFRVVVATHRRPQWLAELLASLVPQIADRPDRELVVVNDGSHDDAYETAIAPFAADIDYRILPAPRGPGAARQHGTEGATAEYLVFTDDDCVAPAYWLDWAEALAKTYPTVDMFGGETRARPGDAAGLLPRIHMPFIPGRTMIDAELICQPTAIMMLRRTAFERIGGFDPEFDQTSEDWNLTCRLLFEGGCEVRLDPQWYTYHHAEQTIRQTWRRWHGYGKGLAQSAIYDRDWRAVLTKRSQGSPRPPESGWIDKLTFPALKRIKAVAHHLGWREGLRIYSARYGRGLPGEPSLADWCAPLALEGAQAALARHQVQATPGEVADRVGGQA